MALRRPGLAAPDLLEARFRTVWLLVRRSFRASVRMADNHTDTLADEPLVILQEYKRLAEITWPEGKALRRERHFPFSRVRAV